MVHVLEVGYCQRCTDIAYVENGREEDKVESWFCK